jgi:heme exporter protein D
MDALGHYLDMGGYARFVWPAYGVAAAVLLALVADTLARARRRRAELARLEAGGKARPQGGARTARDDA